MPSCWLGAEFWGMQRASIKNNRWFNWHELGVFKEEKRLIFKLDIFILIYGCLVSF